MKLKKQLQLSSTTLLLAAIFLLINGLGGAWIWHREVRWIENTLSDHGEHAEIQLNEVMADYTLSFQLFVCLLDQLIQAHPDPDEIWNELKGMDSTLAQIEQETFDSVYMVYQDRYLYSWDTPYAENESTGYQPQARPWYQNAVKGQGAVVFTPPYMSYANHYILSTISQLQPDQETVFAYDIKMGNIQQLVHQLRQFDQEQLMIFDNNGTIIGSDQEAYLGSVLSGETAAAEKALRQAEEARDKITEQGQPKQKAQEEAEAAALFLQFLQTNSPAVKQLLDQPAQVLPVKIDQRHYYGTMQTGESYHVLLLVPLTSLLAQSVQVWLLPLLSIELILVYGLSRIRKELHTRELRQAYIELGQTQKRLEIALKAAQKAAAIDDLTGMMNVKSFCQNVTEQIQHMQENDHGILIFLDGDHFKTINDTYGHQVGDEVIKLASQMIIGRIRTIDLASRLHGDEFAIFVSNTQDYQVARKIVEDINTTLLAESARRHMPNITLSAGAVIATRKSSYPLLAKQADQALYDAKATHNGGFAHA